MGLLRLITVSESQFPDLLKYLENHLPDSWLLHGKVLSKYEGLWDGRTFVALVDTQWPNILAVGEGEVDKERCKCAKYFSEIRAFSFFAPDKESAKKLILWPGYIDFTKIQFIQGLPRACYDAFMEVRTDFKGERSFRCILKEVKPEDLVPRAIPAGMTAGVLTPDMAEYIASIWPHNRPYVDTYLAELIKTFPSVTLLDSDGSMVGFQLVSDRGDMSFLHVAEKYRGKGYAKVIVSLLAQKRFDEGRSAVSVLILDNETSLRLHEELGFKPLCNLMWHYHPGNEGTTWEEMKELRKNIRKID